MAKHAKKEALKVSMPLSKFILSIVLLALFGFCVGGLIAYILVGGFPIKLLML